MNKTLLALAALAMFSLGTVQAIAMVLPPSPGPCSDCGGGGDNPDDPSPCIIDCGGGGGGPGGPGGPGGGNPPPDPHDEADKASEVCNAALGELRKVTEEQIIEFINEKGVRIVPVCERNSALMRFAQIDSSQAIQLRDEIAANPALNDPLHQRGYVADYVVGVIIGEKGATLYVHKGV